MKIKQRVAGGPYYVHFTGPEGQRLRISTGTSDESLAQLKALEVMREHLVDKLPDDLRAKHVELETLGGLLRAAWHAQWKDQRSSRERHKQIAKISREIGHWPLASITFDRVKTWLDGLTVGKHDPQPLTPATKNRYVSSIHTAISLAQQKNPSIVVPKLPHWTEKNVKERYLTKEEELQVLQWFALNTAPADLDRVYLSHLFVVLLDTGMRCSEALEEMAEGSVLRRPDGSSAVHLRHGCTKSGRGRVVPLTPRARLSVEGMLASPLHGTWTNRDAGPRWRRLMGELGIEGVSLHTLRHTCASRLVQANVDLYKVMTWLGHSSMVVTQRYAHFAPDSLSSALDALTAAHGDSRSAAYPGAEAHPPLSGTQIPRKLFAVK